MATARNSYGEAIDGVQTVCERDGLAVTTAAPGDRKDCRYRITHTASGEGIGRFKNKPAALEAFKALLGLGIDWMASKETVSTAGNAAKVREAIGQL